MLAHMNGYHKDVIRELKRQIKNTSQVFVSLCVHVSKYD